MSCFVEGCARPATHSAFFDGWMCWDHYRAVVDHGGIAGCVPANDGGWACCCEGCLWGLFSDDMLGLKREQELEAALTRELAQAAQ